MGENKISVTIIIALGVLLITSCLFMFVSNRNETELPKEEYTSKTMECCACADCPECDLCCTCPGGEKASN